MPGSIQARVAVTVATFIHSWAFVTLTTLKWDSARLT